MTATQDNISSFLFLFSGFQVLYQRDFQGYNREWAVAHFGVGADEGLEKFYGGCRFNKRAELFDSFYLFAGQLAAERGFRGRTYLQRQNFPYIMD